MKDLVQAANDAQSINHAMSLSLRHLAITAPPERRGQLTLLAAAAELASDKAMLIMESAKADN